MENLVDIRPLGTERSSAWLERQLWELDVAGSNPVAPTIFSIPLKSPLFWAINRLTRKVGGGDYLPLSHVCPQR